MSVVRYCSSLSFTIFLTLFILHTSPSTHAKRCCRTNPSSCRRASARSLGRNPRTTVGSQRPTDWPWSDWRMEVWNVGRFVARRDVDIYHCRRYVDAYRRTTGRPTTRWTSPRSTHVGRKTDARMGSTYLTRLADYDRRRGHHAAVYEPLGRAHVLGGHRRERRSTVDGASGPRRRGIHARTHKQEPLHDTLSLTLTLFLSMCQPLRKLSSRSACGSGLPSAMAVQKHQKNPWVLVAEEPGIACYVGRAPVILLSSV